MKKVIHRLTLIGLAVFFISVGLFLCTPVAFANGQINEIECSGVPRWVSFKIMLNYDLGIFRGEGRENYLGFQLDCKQSPDGRKIACVSPKIPIGGNKKVSAVITIDKSNIVTASFHGIYGDNHNLKIGCIAGM